MLIKRTTLLTENLQFQDLDKGSAETKNDPHILNVLSQPKGLPCGLGTMETIQEASVKITCRWEEGHSTHPRDPGGCLGLGFQGYLPWETDDMEVTNYPGCEVAYSNTSVFAFPSLVLRSLSLKHKQKTGDTLINLVKRHNSSSLLIIDKTFGL